MPELTRRQPGEFREKTVEIGRIRESQLIRNQIYRYRRAGQLRLGFFRLTLKEESTKPASFNLLQQQERFADFFYVYKNERPHQALVGAYPGPNPFAPEKVLTMFPE